MKTVAGRVQRMQTPRAIGGIRTRGPTAVVSVKMLVIADSSDQ
jgi:hypothetical protein